MTDRFLEANGVRLHLVEEGEGPTLLFLHGFPEFWYGWKAQLAEFGRDHHAVAVDMRGYNLSEKPEAVSAYAVPELVADVKDLLAQLSPDRPAVLVGHDWGGVVAWAFAALHPQALSKLVILNAPHPTVFARELASNPLQQKASAYVSLFRSPRAEAALGGVPGAAVFENSVRPDCFTAADRAAYLEAWSQPGALTAGLNYYRAMPVDPPSEHGTPLAANAKLALAQAVPVHVPVPTLVIWGEQDTFLLPGNLQGLEAYVPDLRIERLSEASHWLHHEQPERVNTLIREFVAA